MTNNDQPRKSGAELPSADELLEILQNESPRKAIRFDFLSNHPSIFRAHHQLTQLASSDDSWIENYPKIPLDQLVHQINQNHSTLTQYIVNTKGQESLYKKLYESLTSQEYLSSSKAIFVFGAASNARVERAIELYKDGVASKIILSGNRPFYSKAAESEAVRMSKVAIEKGVPANDLLLEEASITIPDNIKRTLDLLETMDWQPSSITVIATNFVLQRAVMDWYKFTPWSITVRAVAAHPQAERFTSEGWHKDEEAIALVLNEYAKLVLESKIDLMRRDGEISHA